MVRNDCKENMEGCLTMIHIYGKVTCETCKKDNRTLYETESSSEAFLMIGDKGDAAWEQHVHETECEYCFHPISVHVLVQNNHISKLVNQSEFDLYEKGSLQVEEVQEGQGMKEEEHPTDFRVYFSTAFENHPLSVGDTITVEGNEWTILRSFKKEHNEMDWQERLEVDFLDSFHYEVKNEKGNYKWVEVIDDEHYNASLLEEGPITLSHEVLYEISETNAKSSKLWEQDFGVQYKVIAYQHISGIQMIVMRKDEEGELIVLDALGEDADVLYREIEEILYINE